MSRSPLLEEEDVVVVADAAVDVSPSVSVERCTVLLLDIDT